MLMVGLFRFALLPHAEPESFEAHMRDEVFDGPALQLTRTTSGFDHQLLLASLRRSGDDGLHSPHPGTQYLWQVTVNLMTDSGYDFEQNAARVQEQVAQFAVLIGVESYTIIEGSTPEEQGPEE